MITDFLLISRIKLEINSIDKQWKFNLKKNLSSIYNKNLVLGKRLSAFENLFDHISNHIKQRYPHFDIWLYGSYGTGLANRNSDLDISIMTNEHIQKNQHPNKKNSVETLKEIDDYLQSMKTILDIEFIFDATVPIVKFKTKKNISGDISANNITAIDRTLLIRQYCDLYPKIFILGKLIKHFIELYDIADTMTSTAYIVMLIHFFQEKYNLQVLTIRNNSANPLGATLKKNAWPTKNLPIRGSWKSRNQIPSIDVLWIEFLLYYTFEFDFANEIVNISSIEKMFKLTKGWGKYLLAIEDPILVANNFGEEVNEKNFQKIKDAFSDVLLKKGKLNCLTTSKRKRR